MSTTILRDYQIDLIEGIKSAWAAGASNVVAQLPTGGGKTVVLAKIIAGHQGYSVATAHRNELVSQMSLTLAKEGIRHDILAPRPTVRTIVTLHVQEFGCSYYQPGARCITAGVDTLIRANDPRFEQVTLYIADEGHHVLKDNKWGAAAAMFPKSCGLFPTATPIRADGRGLGRHADGLADVLVEGPQMRELIERGYLTDYRIFAPTSDIDLSHVPVSAGGDYSPPKLREAVHKSHIVGDVVAHYLRIAPGKLGLTFAADVECASDIAQAYRNAGVPAEVVSGKTPHLLRASLMRRFRNREILQLVNVDLLGEGVDVPAIEVVSMARPTCSYAVYAQQFGRALRPMPGKSHAIVIDHVGNVLLHGLPDRPRVWSLDRRERRARSTQGDSIPMRVCGNAECVAVFERIYKACPYCGFVTPPSGRSSPEQVDGDLTELDSETLEKLRCAIGRVDSIIYPPSQLDAIAKRAIVNRHMDRQQHQKTLRDRISLWAGYYKTNGCSDSEIYRRFFFTFGVDVLTAQTLNTRDTNDLDERIEQYLKNKNVKEIEEC